MGDPSRPYKYYKGEWKEDTMHGYGEYIWKAFYNNAFAFPLQNYYKGSWENGKRTGQGIMVLGYDNGFKLKGVWEQDFKHGDGYLVCGNGRVVQGKDLFQNDRPSEIDSSASCSNPFYRVTDFPMFTGPEYVDVGFYVDKVLSKLQDVNSEKIRLVRTFEEKCIKNVIVKYLPQLKELYREYANIAAKTTLTYEPVLVRLFLWQLYKDKEIHRRGISLAETDNILTKHPNSSLDDTHNPFEPIYFWQFLMSLIGIALSTSRLEEMVDDSQQKGVSAAIVRKFFDELFAAKTEKDTLSKIYRKAKHSLLLNYMDLAPIKAVYSLYKKIGEPHTARTFLRESSSRKGETPIWCHLELFLKKARAKFGINLVSLSQNVTFENRQADELDERLKRNWTNLFDFRHLGPKNVLQCLAKACPLIMERNLIVNIDYPLIFLEFYETLLTCIFRVLELELKKEHKILYEQCPNKVTKTQLIATKLKSELKSKGSKEGKKKEKKSAKKKKKK